LISSSYSQALLRTNSKKEPHAAHHLERRLKVVVPPFIGAGDDGRK
jgi:hypothetical protein